MASSGNFANNNIHIRPADGASYPIVPTNGGRTVSSGSGSWGAPTTMAATSGKWYIEYYVNAGSSGRNVGMVPTNSGKYNQGNYNQGTAGDYAITINSSGALYNNGTQTQTVASSLATGDIMAVAMNLDSSPKTVQFYKNGSTLGTAENINASATGHFAFMTKGHNASTITINAGQDSSFAGAKSTGTANAADDNGFGNFYYSPPSGFLAMCTANLPVDENIDPAQTDDNHPQKQFGIVTYTGDGSSRTISGLGFQPDFIWAKRRDGARRHYLVDSVRGFTKYLHSEGNYSQGTSTATGASAGVTSATSDGFVIGGALDYVNANTHTYVAWCWRAGGTSSTNTSGTITSTVSANQNAGFSVVTYTGNDGTWGSGNRDTFGHGLSSAPECIFLKESNATDQWTVFHAHVGNGGGSNAAANNLVLNSNAVLYTNQSYKAWGETMPTSTVVTVEGNTTNLSTSTHVAYCWHSVEGYSKFGSYEGNNNDDGIFVYTGFRPRMLWIKNLDTAAEWCCFDTARGVNNPISRIMQWDEDYEERGNALGTNQSAELDFLANGFKCRENGSRINTSHTFVYGAWADVPLKYNNTF